METTTIIEKINGFLMDEFEVEAREDYVRSKPSGNARTGQSGLH